MAKTYLNGILIKEVKTQYGSMLNISIKKDDFIAELNKHDKNGWVNITLAERKEKHEKGYTHSCFLNEFKKDENYKKPEDTTYKEPESDKESDDLPF